MGSGDREFDSLRTDHSLMVSSTAVVQMAVNHQVVGSIPTLPANKSECSAVALEAVAVRRVGSSPIKRTSKCSYRLKVRSCPFQGQDVEFDSH